MKNTKNTLIVLGVVVVLAAAGLIAKGITGGETKSASLESDLFIPKSEVTETAGFYPVSIGKTKMEIIAV